MTSAYVLHPMRLSFAELDEVRAMPVGEAKDLFEDFIRIVPSRLTQLQRVVVLDPPFREWKADFSRESLEALGRWFCRRLFLTDDDLIDVLVDEPIPLEGLDQRRISSCYMTERGHSMEIDLGVYWGECLRHSERGFVWKRISQPENHGCLNFPSITGSRIGFEFVPWHNLHHWIGRFFERRADEGWPLWLFDKIIATPRIGERSRDWGSR